jgi:hypothetical protein
MAGAKTGLTMNKAIKKFGRTLFFDTNNAARIRIGHGESEARKGYARAIAGQ